MNLDLIDGSALTSTQKLVLRVMYGFADRGVIHATNAQIIARLGRPIERRTLSGIIAHLEAEGWIVRDGGARPGPNRTMRFGPKLRGASDEDRANDAGRPMTAGEQVKSLRLDRKQSLRDVRTSTGISLDYLSRLERGEAGPPTPRMAARLAEHFGCPIHGAKKRNWNRRMNNRADDNDDDGDVSAIGYDVDRLDKLAIRTAIKIRRRLDGEHDSAPEFGGDVDGAALAEVCRGWLEMMGKLGEYNDAVDADE